MELKSDDLFVLRSDTATVDAAQVAPFFDPGDGRMCIQEVGDLNVLGTVISRDPAQDAWARLHKAEGTLWPLADFFSRCGEISFEDKAELYARRVCSLRASTWIGRARRWGCSCAGRIWFLVA